MHQSLIATVLVVFLALAGCGREKGVTEVCETADECVAGLSCVEMRNSTGTACGEVAGSSCTKTCSTDADCTSLEAGLTCLTQCDNTKVCGRLATP